MAFQSRKSKDHLWTTKSPFEPIDKVKETCLMDWNTFRETKMAMSSTSKLNKLEEDR